MNYDASLLHYFLNASLVVQCVMVILVGCSVFSWSYILQRTFQVRSARRATRAFERAFWSGEELSQLYLSGAKNKEYLHGVEAIFHAGFKEFSRLRKQTNATLEQIMENTQRAMRVAQMREQDRLESNLSFLAIVSSMSPYIGLFGTVWGIMTALHALANVQQASIAMVAPGISEALIATALGLFAAIPAGIAYNRFVTGINGLMNRYDAFQEELINLLIRQSHPQTPVHFDKVEN